jgi:hypothetical protein
MRTAELIALTNIVTVVALPLAWLLLCFASLNLIFKWTERKQERSITMKRLLAIMLLVGAILSWLVLGASHAQVSCFSYPGGVVSCDGPRGQHTEQWEMSPGQGMLYDQRGNVQPYAVFPTPPSALSPTRPGLGAPYRAPSLQPPTAPTLPPSTFETPTTPLFLPGFGGEAGSP